MIRRLLASAAMVLAAASASAATIKLDLDSFAYGDAIGDYYNGGRDSHNRQGGNDYGLSFANASIMYRPRGAYLAGPAVLTIDPAKLRAALGGDAYYITFRGGRYGLDDGQGVRVVFEDGYSEPQAYLGGNANPFCPERPEFCGYPHRGTMGGHYVLAYDSFSLPTRVYFGSDRLDEIEIHSYILGEALYRPDGFMGSEALDRDIPEPASLALFGAAGALAFLARRRRKS